MISHISIYIERERERERTRLNIRAEQLKCFLFSVCNLSHIFELCAALDGLGGATGLYKNPDAVATSSVSASSEVAKLDLIMFYICLTRLRSMQTFTCNAMSLSNFLV
jgi:hypothetical protein